MNICSNNEFFVTNNSPPVSYSLRPLTIYNFRTKCRKSPTGIYIARVLVPLLVPPSAGQEAGSIIPPALGVPASGSHAGVLLK